MGARGGTDAPPNGGVAVDGVGVATALSRGVEGLDDRKTLERALDRERPRIAWVTWAPPHAIWPASVPSASSATQYVAASRVLNTASMVVSNQAACCGVAPKRSRYTRLSSCAAMVNRCRGSPHCSAMPPTCKTPCTAACSAWVSKWHRGCAGLGCSCASTAVCMSNMTCWIDCNTRCCAGATAALPSELKGRKGRNHELRITALHITAMQKMGRPTHEIGTAE